MDLNDVSQAAVGYIIKPQIAKAKIGIDFATNLYRKTLANPTGTRQWRQGLELFKRGQVKAGIAILDRLGKRVSRDDRKTKKKTTQE